MGLVSVKARYEEAERLIRGMCNVRFPKKAEASFKRYMRIFTELLQGIMLYSILTDKVVAAEEKELLIATGKYGNVFDRINSQAAFEDPKWEPLSLEMLENLTEEQQAHIIRVLPPSMELSTQAFVKSFAEMDYAISKRDYLGELADIIEAIIIEVIKSDGDSMECQRANDEYNSARKAFIKMLSDNWESHSPEIRRPYILD